MEGKMSDAEFQQEHLKSSDDVNPDYVKNKVWKKASEDAKRYISDYKDFWIILCTIVHIHKERGLIYGHMFYGRGQAVRPKHWIPEETFQELISLAKQNGKIED
jgi:hypothetical protein